MSINGILWNADFKPQNYWLFNITVNGKSTSYKNGECTTTEPKRLKGSSRDCEKYVQPYTPIQI
jgi:hypothetical protein